ncbi:hypothetical protein BH10ACT6_BH10ACT6_09730 [soil metagenome]
MEPSAFSRDPESAEGRARAAARAVVLRPRADTPQVAALQLLPLLPVVLGMSSVLFARGWSTSNILAFLVLTCVMQYLVARRDVGALGRRGFVEQAPAAFALVSSALYLAIRARRCDGLDPSAHESVPWAIGTTIASTLILVLGTVFQLAVAGIFENVTIG